MPLWCDISYEHYYIVYRCLPRSNINITPTSNIGVCGIGIGIGVCTLDIRHRGHATHHRCMLMARHTCGLSCTYGASVQGMYMCLGSKFIKQGVHFCFFLCSWLLGLLGLLLTLALALALTFTFATATTSRLRLHRFAFLGTLAVKRVFQFETRAWHTAQFALVAEVTFATGFVATLFGALSAFRAFATPTFTAFAFAALAFATLAFTRLAFTALAFTLAFAFAFAALAFAFAALCLLYLDLLAPIRTLTINGIRFLCARTGNASNVISMAKLRLLAVTMSFARELWRFFNTHALLGTFAVECI